MTHMHTHSPGHAPVMPTVQVETHPQNKGVRTVHMMMPHIAQASALIEKPAIPDTDKRVPATSDKVLSLISAKNFG